MLVLNPKNDIVDLGNSKKNNVLKLSKWYILSNTVGMYNNVVLKYTKDSFAAGSGIYEF